MSACLPQGLTIQNLTPSCFADYHVTLTVLSDGRTCHSSVPRQERLGHRLMWQYQDIRESRGFKVEQPEKDKWCIKSNGKQLTNVIL